MGIFLFYFLRSGNRRVIVNITDYGASSPAIPDGMVIDRDGMLWVALIFEGAVSGVFPTFKQLNKRSKN